MSERFGFFKGLLKLGVARPAKPQHVRTLEQQ